MASTSKSVPKASVEEDDDDYRMEGEDLDNSDGFREVAEFEKVDELSQISKDIPAYQPDDPAAEEVDESEPGKEWKGLLDDVAHPTMNQWNSMDHLRTKPIYNNLSLKTQLCLTFYCSDMTREEIRDLFDWSQKRPLVLNSRFDSWEAKEVLEEMEKEMKKFSRTVGNPELQLVIYIRTWVFLRLLLIKAFIPFIKERENTPSAKIAQEILDLLLKSKCIWVVLKYVGSTIYTALQRILNDGINIFIPIKDLCLSQFLEQLLQLSDPSKAAFSTQPIIQVSKERCKELGIRPAGAMLALESIVERNFDETSVNACHVNVFPHEAKTTSFFEIPDKIRSTCSSMESLSSTPTLFVLHSLDDSTERDGFQQSVEDGIETLFGRKEEVDLEMVDLDSPVGKSLLEDAGEKTVLVSSADLIQSLLAYAAKQQTKEVSIVLRNLDGDEVSIPFGFEANNHRTQMDLRTKPALDFTITLQMGSVTLHIFQIAGPTEFQSLLQQNGQIASKYGRISPDDKKALRSAVNSCNSYILASAMFSVFGRASPPRVILGLKQSLDSSAKWEWCSLHLAAASRKSKLSVRCNLSDVKAGGPCVVGLLGHTCGMQYHLQSSKGLEKIPATESDEFWLSAIIEKEDMVVLVSRNPLNQQSISSYPPPHSKELSRVSLVEFIQINHHRGAPLLLATHSLISDSLINVEAREVERILAIVQVGFKNDITSMPSPESLVKPGKLVLDTRSNRRVFRIIGLPVLSSLGPPTHSRALHRSFPSSYYAFGQALAKEDRNQFTIPVACELEDEDEDEDEENENFSKQQSAGSNPYYLWWPLLQGGALEMLLGPALDSNNRPIQIVSGADIRKWKTVFALPALFLYASAHRRNLGLGHTNFFFKVISKIDPKFLEFSDFKIKYVLKGPEYADVGEEGIERFLQMINDRSSGHSSKVWRDAVDDLVEHAARLLYER